MQDLPGARVLLHCPAGRRVLQQLTSRWGGLVLLVLRSGTKRFSELRKELDGVSERMLTQTLQYLEQDGLLVRHSFNTMPPHVEYSLTGFGEEAAEHLASLVEWLDKSLPLEAREGE